jgi:putative restriction endonuclease
VAVSKCACEDLSSAFCIAVIHQFKRGGSCHPTNGIALSKTAHWLFDHGFWSLSDDFRVLVAESKFEESGDAMQLLKPRAGTEILRPAHACFWPDLESLRWQRKMHQFMRKIVN